MATKISSPRHRGLGEECTISVHSFGGVGRGFKPRPGVVIFSSSTSFRILDYTSLRNKSRLPRCTFQKSEEGKEKEKEGPAGREARNKTS